MPVNSYYGGHGNQVMDNMVSEYGPDKGKSVFFALNNKRKQIKPAFEGTLGIPQPGDPMPPSPPPPRQPMQMSPSDGPMPSSQGAIPSGMPPMPPQPPPMMAGMPSGPGPIPPPPMPPSPTVLNTVPQDMGSNPLYRKGMIAGLEKADEGPATALAGKSKIGTGLTAEQFDKAAADYYKTATQKTPWWKEALGLTLQGLAPMSSRAGGLASAIGGKLTGDDEKAKALALATNMGKLAEEKRKEITSQEQTEIKGDALASGQAYRDTQASTRETNAETHRLAVEASKAHIQELTDAEYRKWVDDQTGPDKVYQKETDTLIPGWSYLKDEKHAGMGWAIPPKSMPVPKELLPHLPGTNPGDLIPYSAYKQAQKDYNDLNKAKAVAGAKPNPNDTLDAATRTAGASIPGWDINNPADVAKARRMVQDDAVRVAASKAQDNKDYGENFVDPTTGKLTRVRPGDVVPTGALKPTTLSSQNAPTMQMRNVGAQAQLVHEQIPSVVSDITRLRDKLGPVAGRWNEVMQGKIGMEDPDFAGLRADLLMTSSAVALMHARGRLPENLRAEFEKAINAPSQDFSNLVATLNHIDAWTVKNMRAMQGGVQTNQGSPTQSIPGATIKWGRDAQGKPVPLSQ